ncbi:MAG: hypothetical protein Q9173_006533 [Seirophora scorigena]
MRGLEGSGKFRRHALYACRRQLASEEISDNAARHWVHSSKYRSLLSDKRQPNRPFAHYNYFLNQSSGSPSLLLFLPTSNHLVATDQEKISLAKQITHTSVHPRPTHIRPRYKRFYTAHTKLINPADAPKASTPNTKQNRSLELTNCTLRRRHLPLSTVEQLPESVDLTAVYPLTGYVFSPAWLPAHYAVPAHPCAITALCPTPTPTPTVLSLRLVPQLPLGCNC